MDACFGIFSVFTNPLESPLAKEWLSSLGPAGELDVAKTGESSQGSSRSTTPVNMSMNVSNDNLNRSVAEGGNEDVDLFKVLKPGHVYSCSLHSSLNFGNRDELAKHVSKHTDEFVCQFCPKSYSSKWNLDSHMKVHTSGRLEEFKCQVESCGKVLGTKGGLSKHVNAMHAWRCENCKLVFETDEELNDHTCDVVVGGNGKSVSCRFCGKAFRTSGTCKRHCDESCLSNPVVMARKYPWKCDLCPDRFQEEDLFKRHRIGCSSMRARGHVYPCKRCNATYTSRDAANAHTKECHPN